MNTQVLDAIGFRDTGVMEFILIGSLVSVLSKHDVLTLLWMEFHIPLSLPFLKHFLDHVGEKQGWRQRCR